MSRKITITLEGEFEEFELLSMVYLLRQIDSRHPDRTYALWIHDPENSLADAEEAIRRIVTPMPGRNTSFSIYRRQ